MSELRTIYVVMSGEDVVHCAYEDKVDADDHADRLRDDPSAESWAGRVCGLVLFPPGQRSVRTTHGYQARATTNMDPRWAPGGTPPYVYAVSSWTHDQPAAAIPDRTIVQVNYAGERALIAAQGKDRDATLKACTDRFEELVAEWSERHSAWSKARVEAE